MFLRESEWHVENYVWSLSVAKRLINSVPKLASHSHLQDYMPAAVEAAFGWFVADCVAKTFI